MNYQESQEEAKRIQSICEQTAIDYDMEVEDVKRIYSRSKKGYEDFYEELERFISERVESDC